ncbi:hypothetical protein [Treponema brennaborense]|uniref:Major outer membrane protein n=1 Tax=Treponema brennaborense (strain DSM 12168 / CIP 105900 / DD5/3) TaxID=906968 RepID=F4LP43_TREBD|nr:hypothetical protein [Treponema brennaborense]AEE15919.1 hypothetical protein Trebr_0475 [Treponema brennaborense DSM 12168]
MKKIIGTLAMAALVMGAASAQTIKLNYRTQANIVTVDKAKDADAAVSFFDLEKYGSAKDSFSFELSGDKAGAYVELEPSLSAIGLAKYYGWLSFGNLKFTAGNFDSRYMNRVSNFGGNYNGVVGEYVKLGGLKKASIIVDADNFGTINGSKLHTMAADYTFAVGESDKLLVKAAVHEKDIKINDTTNWVAASLGLGYSMKSFGTAEVIFRNTAKDTYVFGAYLRPNALVKNLDAVAGFTLGMGKDSADKSVTEMGIDARAQYKINDVFSVATNMNFTQYQNEKWGMWIAGNATYKMNDVVTGKLTGSYIDESKNAGTKTVNGLLGGEFTATKNASISTGVEVRYDLDTEGMKLYVPCILRVKL